MKSVSFLTDLPEVSVHPLLIQPGSHLVTESITNLESVLMHNLSIECSAAKEIASDAA